MFYCFFCRTFDDFKAKHFSASFNHVNRLRVNVVRNKERIRFVLNPRLARPIASAALYLHQAVTLMLALASWVNGYLLEVEIASKRPWAISGW